MKRFLFLLLCLPVVAFGQFRMVSSTVTLNSTVNDSTYIISVDFFSDQTAKGYFASGITADYRVFSQTGQLYDITAASNLTLSSGELTIVEIDNNYVNTELAPTGQILVFDPQGDYITYTPFGNSNMGQVLQQAVGTYNAVVSSNTSGTGIAVWDSTETYEQFQQVSQAGKIYTNKTGTNTTTLPGNDPTNWEVTNKTEILNDIDGRDTISQASHGFSVGDPLWYSGDYILARDTGASVRVDGIVVEVIDVNAFVRQRSGKFTLSSHGFTANIQLYVQDDGTYNATVGNNSLAYGYAPNANEIIIGLKPDQVPVVANRYLGAEITGITKKDLAIDFLKRVSDTTRIDRLTFTNSNVDSTYFKIKSKNLDININTNSSASQNYVLRLPDVNNIDSTIVTIRRKSDNTDYSYYIQAFDSTQFEINGYPVDRYFVNKNETVSIESKDGIWKATSDYQPLKAIFQNEYYNHGDRVGRYLIEGAPAKSTSSSVTVYDSAAIVIPVLNKKIYDKNQFHGSEDMISWGSSNIWLNTVGTGGLAESNVTYGPFDTDGIKTAEKWSIRDGVSTGYIRAEKINTTLSLSPGDVFTVSGWIKPGAEAFNDNLTITLRDVNGVMSPASVALSIDATNKEWQYFEQTCTWVSGTDERLDFVLTGDAGDYVYVNRFNWSYGPKALEYNKTTPNTSYDTEVDTLYAVYYPQNGVAQPGDIFNVGSKTDDQIVNVLFDYGKYSGLFNIVKLDRDLTTYGPITVPEEMILDLNGFVIDYQGSDTTVNIVNFVNDGVTAYTENQELRPGTIRASRKANSAVTFYEADKIKLNGLIIDGQDSLKIGINPLPGSNSSLFAEISQPYITGCDTAIIMNNANRTDIFLPKVLNNKYGLFVKAGSVNVYGGNIEDSDTSALYVTGGSVKISGTYFEGTPTADYSNDYILYLSGGGKHILQGLTFNGSDYSPNAVVYSDDIEKLTIRDTYFSSGAGRPFDISCNTEKWKIDGVTTQTATQVASNYYRISDCLENGTIIDVPDAFYGNKIPNINSENSKIDTIILSSITFADTARFSNFWIEAHRPNMGQNSELLPDGSYASGNITVISNAGPKWNGETGVSQDSTAELVYASSTVSSTSAWFSWSLFEGVQAGKTYCIRINASRLGGNGTPRLIIRTGAGDESTIAFDYEGEGYKEYWQRFTPDVSTSTLTVRFGPWADGDSLLLSGLTINEGYFPEPYYFTDASDPGEEQPSINIKNGDTLRIGGRFEASPDYFFKTGTATPTTDLNGEFSITHGLGDTPTFVSVSNESGTEYNFEIVSRSSTIFVVKVYDGTGTDTTVDSTGISISWGAFR